MRLFVDYEMVTRAVEMGVDAKYEPYYAFGLTVTLIWLYLEDNGLEKTERDRLGLFIICGDQPQCILSFCC